jgi:hypothetical protein
VPPSPTVRVKKWAEPCPAARKLMENHDAVGIGSHGCVLPLLYLPQVLIRLHIFDARIDDFLSALKLELPIQIWTSQ